MTEVKICGLSSPELAITAAEAGASFLGLIFAASRRRISPTQASEIIQAVRECGFKQYFVGVFVNETPENIAIVAEAVGLDIIQLSGNEEVSAYVDLGYPLIKVVRGAEGETAKNVGPIKTLHSWPQQGSTREYLPLVDGPALHSYGGTGATADWAEAATISERGPLMLAGGLTPENVAAAIQKVRPWAVDVSSGVELNGFKDKAKINAFIREVRYADDK